MIIVPSPVLRFSCSTLNLECYEQTTRSTSKLLSRIYHQLRMCGILFTAAHKEQPEATSDRLRVLREALEHANAARGMHVHETTWSKRKANNTIGPDAQRRLELDAESPNETQRLAGLSLSFFASELLLRGDSMIVQPHHVENHVFCWNGEVCMPTRLRSSVLLLIRDFRFSKD